MGAKHKSVAKNDEKTTPAAEAPEDEAEAPEEKTKDHKDKAAENDNDMDIADYVNDYVNDYKEKYADKYTKDYKEDYAKDYDGGNDDYDGMPKSGEKDGYDWMC